MSALAILSCRQNSHPFQERHIALHEAAKIGRSVARARPALNNGIFDCKVLSRNHAMLWYENGTFYLQDTKSSNGTFINDQRLCKGGEESPPREVYSGDLIQFGVNVMENNRRGEKITHGCIIATITLYHPDGREAKPILFNTPTPGITIQSQELYKLAQCLQEALHREKMLEQKLSSLQDLIQNTQESAEGGWQALIDEDRLLSRLEVLENQLHAYSKSHSEDALRQELVTLQEEKLNYETTAKESLMKVLQEKIEAVTKLSDLERSLTKSEDECGHLKDMCEKSQEELQLLAEKYQDQLREIQDIQIQLQDAETKHLEDIEKVEKDKMVLTEKLDKMVKQETILTAQVEALQADKDISTQQLTTMKAHLDQFKDVNEADHENNMKMLDSEEKSVDSDNEVITSVIIPTTVDKDSLDQLPEDVEGKLKETQQQIEIYKMKLEESEKQLQESAAKVEELQRELELSHQDSLQYAAKMNALEDKLKLSDMHMNQMVENTMADLKLQMSETSKQSNSSNDLINNLQSQVKDLEDELSLYKIPQPEHASLDTTIQQASSQAKRESLDTTIQQESSQGSSVESSHESSPEADSADYPTLRPKYDSQEDEELQKLLSDAKRLLSTTELELGKCKDELEDSKQQTQKTNEENSALKDQLSRAQSQVVEKSGMVIDLQDQLQKAENTTKEVKEQILCLRDQLVEEQELSKKNQEEITVLLSNLDEEKTQHKDTQKSFEEVKGALEEEKVNHESTKKSLSEAKKTLSESQQSAKQSQNEATQLRNLDQTARNSPAGEDKLRQQEVADVRSSAAADSRRDQTPEKRAIPHLKHPYHAPESPSRLPVSKRQANEYTALKEECASLRKRIQAIEGEMKMSRRENLQLSSEYNKLQESYKQLEELLKDKETTWMSNLTDSQKETETGMQELEAVGLPSQEHVLKKAKEEITVLKKRCEECDHEITRLKGEIKRLNSNYSRIANRSKVISFCSSIPLLMLLFAILLAIYPTLEAWTAIDTT